VAKFEYFAGQGNDEADWAWFLAQKGIASYSIGFIGHQYDWIKEKDGEGNERITGRRFTEVELLEVSQVLIPSNRGALQSERSIAQESLELCDMAIKSFKDGDYLIGQGFARKVLDDRTWQCECGNSYAFVEGAKEFVCKCGQACTVKLNNPHYSDEVLGKEAVEPAISAPKSNELSAEEFKAALEEAVATTTKEKV
jgi:hypothetical protein